MKKVLMILMMMPMLCFAQTNVLNSCLKNLEKQTLEAAFTVTITEKASQPVSFTGNIVMRGECFIAEFMGTEMAYDGKTLYTYNEDTDELTLSYPTQDELAEANPLLFAKNIADSYEAETKEQSGNYQITLRPDKSTGVREFTLLVRKSDLMPLYASMKEIDMRTTTLTLRQQKFTDEKPDFKLEKPGAFINDLR